MNDLQVIEYNVQQKGKVFFGAYVEIEADDDSSILKIRIVGGDEIFGRSNYISIDSPMAKALLGKEEGGDAEVVTPKGKRLWYVNRISYESPDWFDEQPIVDNQMQDEDDLEIEDSKPLTAEEQKRIEQEYLKTLVK